MKKTFCLLLSLLMVVCAITPTMIASATAEPMDDAAEGVLFDPSTGKYIPVHNAEEEFAAITEESESDKEFERLFEQKRSMQAELANEPESMSTLNSSDPIPGGVGYGVYYNSSFQTTYTTGTTISHDIVCPTNLGGDVTTTLYLTSTNRAAMGVEALIGYGGQGDMFFRVYDWSRPDGDRWQALKKYNQLGSYLTKKTIDGVSRQCVSLQNVTVQVSATQWKNVVYLMNYSTGNYDSVYSHVYTATLAEQREQGGRPAFWGPIVETFQDSYNVRTNVMGFANTWMLSKTSSYSSDTWKEWEALTNSNSYIMGPSKGFELVYLLPNYTFLVH